MLTFDSRTLCEPGRRDNQEDSVYPAVGGHSPEGIFIVCDGMGGHEAGEIASALVCDALSSHPELFFDEALDRAYDALDANDRGTGLKMGTTLAYLRIIDDKAYIAHIGDSRIYHIRPSENLPLFVTKDHSLVNELVAAGVITPAQARTHPKRNIITRAMQPDCVRTYAEIDVIEDLRPGDWFFVCSDGMLECLEDINIVNILSMDRSIDEKLEIMRSVTSDASDNHSAHLVKIEDEKE